jgi:glycosyltransferase involved in cell wall biosynthesis
VPALLRTSHSDSVLSATLWPRRVQVALTRRRVWPFLGIVDADGRDCGWCGLTGPLRRQADLDIYDELRRTFRMVGFSSHVTFPAVSDGLVKDYGRLCDGWCHCFRGPDDYISPASPKALISESDFVDYRTVSPQTICGTRAPKKDFDFMYVCLPGRWTETTKNWALAKACLYRLCDDLSLEGLLLGRWQILDLPFRRNLTIMGDVPRRTVLEYIGRSRMVFVPSLMDASPRLLAEALCMGVPILVNREILGGWKYVSQSTGAFFSSDDDVAQAAAQCLSGPTDPRAWFRANYGPMRSSQRLSGFLHSLDGDMDPKASLRLAYEALVPPAGVNPGLRPSRSGITQSAWLRPPPALTAPRSEE